jgi:protein SDA1
VAAGGGSNAKRKLADLEAAKKAAHTGEHLDNVFVSENDILGPRKKSKATYEERMASVHEGREGREKFGSNKGRKKETGGSSTNKEKLKNKPIMMIMGSQRIRGKRKASLRDKQNRLRKHVDGQKRRQK